MRRHMMRLLFLLVACMFEFVWLIWKARNPLTPDEFATEFFTACAAVLAVAIVLAWATWVDLRTQGLLPQGVFAADHRGRKMALRSSFARATFLQAGVPLVVRKEWRRRDRTPAVTTGHLLGVIIIYVGGAALSRFLLPPTWRFWGWLLAFFFFVLTMLLLLRRGLMLTAVRSSAEAAAFGICGACAFDIRNIEPQDDGCTICPACGAAWCVEMLPRPAPTADASVN